MSALYLFDFSWRPLTDTERWLLRYGPVATAGMVALSFQVALAGVDVLPFLSSTVSGLLGVRSLAARQALTDRVEPVDTSAALIQQIATICWLLSPILALLLASRIPALLLDVPRHHSLDQGWFADVGGRCLYATAAVAIAALLDARQAQEHAAWERAWWHERANRKERRG